VAGVRRLHAPTVWDALAFCLLFSAIVLVIQTGRETFVPLASLNQHPISLDAAHLPEYALRTTMRMLAALVASLVFTFGYGALAAKSRRAELVLVPLLDILQSVPILGFLSFTVVAFMALFPGSVVGLELASIFAIFTSQAWNMTFSFYQSLKTVPANLDEAARSFHLSAWQHIWRVDVPFSMPGLVWNTMMSMSGGWFFVVASEAITVNNHTLMLPGIGSYVALAIDQRNLTAIGWAVLTMLIVILLYDQLLFRPLVAWSDKFHVELSAGEETPRSWFLLVLHRTRLFGVLFAPLTAGAAFLAQRPLRTLPRRMPAAPARAPSAGKSEWLWRVTITLAIAAGVGYIVDYLSHGVTWTEVATVTGLGFLTLLRVVVLMLLATLVWVPIGVWIGLHPRVAHATQPLAQFLAAFPANLVFPFAVVAIVHWHLTPDIWLSPLMVLGTQWYILFNVIAGASAFPNDLKEAAANFRIGGWNWWRKVILPGIFPYYVTGAITASGGCWNASIVAEIASWGDTTLRAHGLGAYIADATTAGNDHQIVLGIVAMSIFVIAFNRLLWRPLYGVAMRRMRLD
jgi:NitT/TauT family transport system permease protein